MKQLRILAFLEGMSLLVLLFVGMPLKYLAAAPMVVRVAGSIHGILFLAFVAGVLEVAAEQRWRRSRIALAIVAAALPFGVFVFERRALREPSAPASSKSSR